MITINSLSKSVFTLIAPIVMISCNKTEKTPSTAINWVSLDKAMILNKENKKKIYICMYTDWCKWCHIFDSATLSNPKIIEFINDNYYAVRLNAETIDTIHFNNNTYMNKSHKMGCPNEFANFLLHAKLNYPASVFLDEELSRIGAPTYGYYKASDFKALLSYYSSDKYKTSTFAEYLKSL
jgi:thioredoxin-related protein